MLLFWMKQGLLRKTIDEAVVKTFFSIVTVRLSFVLLS